MKLDIEALAREAGFGSELWLGHETPPGYFDSLPLLEAFARLIVERCAAVCDELPAPASCTGVERSLWDVATMAAGDAVLKLMEDK
jgi:hypothetical protein